MLTWIIVAVVVVAVGALVWWSSGRKPRYDVEGVRRGRGKAEGDIGMQAGRPTGGQFHPGSSGGSGSF